MEETFDSILDLSAKDQCVRFLNGFWGECKGKTEDIYKQHQKFLELDKLQYNALPENKKSEEYTEGRSLDEFWSHKYLESCGQTMTVVAFRQEFNKIDCNSDKHMSMIEYLLYDNKQTVEELLRRKVGAMDPELAAALAAYDEVSVELKKLEKEKERLRKESKNAGVKGKTAANQLAQLEQSELPPEVKKAIIKAESAVKRAQKKAEESGTGPTPGTTWWVQRDVEELKKYKPKPKN